MISRRPVLSDELLSPFPIDNFAFDVAMITVENFKDYAADSGWEK